MSTRNNFSELSPTLQSNTVMDLAQERKLYKFMKGLVPMQVSGPKLVDSEREVMWR